MSADGRKTGTSRPSVAAARPLARQWSWAPRTAPRSKSWPKPGGQTNKATLHGFVVDTAAPGATVHTGEHPAHRGLPNRYARYAVKHGVKEYVRGQVSTQGIDSFWSMVKRGYAGTFHHYSPKHLHRYINEFAGRHNDRPQDTVDQMAAMVCDFVGKRLRYQDLTAGGTAYPPPEAD